MPFKHRAPFETNSRTALSTPGVSLTHKFGCVTLLTLGLQRSPQQADGQILSPHLPHFPSKVRLPYRVVTPIRSTLKEQAKALEGTLSLNSENDLDQSGVSYNADKVFSVDAGERASLGFVLSSKATSTCLYQTLSRLESSQHPLHSPRNTY